MSNELTEIVDRCLALEEQACTTYRELSWRRGDAELCAFWREMSDEEHQHIMFWKGIRPLAHGGGIPEIFDRPYETVRELGGLLETTGRLQVRLQSDLDPRAALNLALHLELHLLHPSFAAFFQYMKSVTGARTPADDYDSHLERFLTAAGRYGDSPELDILRETILSLWRQNRDLARITQVDALTGLLNRRGLTHATTSLAHLAQRGGGTVGVLMVDIDHFKKVNDRFGHQAGDRVLAVVGPAVKAALRQSDVAGRYGGEEFLVFLPQVEPGALSALGEKIRQSVAVETSQITPVTVSVGGAEGSIRGDPQTGFNELVSAADVALYAAKAGGRNRVVLAKPAEQARVPQLVGVTNSK